MLPSSLTGYNHLIKVIEDKGEPPRHKDMWINIIISYKFIA